MSTRGKIRSVETAVLTNHFPFSNHFFIFFSPNVSVQSFCWKNTHKLGSLRVLIIRHDEHKINAHVISRVRLKSNQLYFLPLLSRHVTYYSRLLDGANVWQSMGTHIRCLGISTTRSRMRACTSGEYIICVSIHVWLMGVWRPVRSAIHRATSCQFKFCTNASV